MVSQLSSCLPVPVSEGSVALHGVGFISHRTSPSPSLLRLPRHTLDVIPPFLRHSWACPVVPVSGLVILGRGRLFLRLPRHTVDVIPPVILGCIRWFPHRVSVFLGVSGYSRVGLGVLGRVRLFPRRSRHSWPWPVIPASATSFPRRRESSGLRMPRIR